MTSNVDARSKARENSFSSIVEALMTDVPLLLHGSGDVVPSQVNPETVHLVSCLTAQYIEKLVDASLDSHFTFLDHPEVFHVPPPSFPRYRLPPKPPPFSVPKPASADATGGTTSTASKSDKGRKKEEPERKRPPKRLREEYWDEGIPMPKIIKSKTSSSTESATAMARNTSVAENVDQPSEQAPLEEWVGVVGVDFRENVIRKAHVKNAVATSSFVFPVCHDVYAYNRVREIRAAKRTLDPLLQDSTINEMIKTEGRIRRRRDLGQARGKDTTEDNENDRLIDQDEGDGGPEWPGLDYVLPVNKLRDLIG